MRVGLAAVDKMTPAQVTRGAMRAIIVAGFVLAVPVTLGHVLDYNLRKQAHHDEHQLKLAEFEKTTIVAKSGQSIAPTARGAVEQAMEVENRQIRSSISDEYEGPFSRFVKLARRKNRHARGQWLLVAVEKRDCLGLDLRLSTSDLAIAFAVAQSAAPTLTTRSPAD
jgi:hypothetical protein